MIITRQKNIPWLWVAFAQLPFAAMLFASAANTVVFSLEIRKFTANPAAIATLMTVTGFLTMFTGPVINWVSDRVWTRWGRRKVFYVPAVCAQALLILLVPFMPNLFWLAVIYFLQFLAMSCKAPKESLIQEVVPNHQRGRAAVFNKIYVQTGLMAYNLALIGRFDDAFPDNPLRSLLGRVDGEQLIFVVFSLALLSIVFLVSLGTKEIRPPARPTMREELGGRITPWRIGRKLFLDIFNSQWWPLYLLAISQAMYGVKLGGMVALMYTDQWEYSTEMLGLTQGVGQAISIVCVLFVFPIIDRFDRLRFYLTAVILGMVGKVLWYAYVMLVVPDQRPSILEIIAVGEVINVLGQLAGIISYPLVYEFIPLNQLGTASAGLGLFRGLLGLILGPLMGLWLLYYSNIFMPGAGSSVTLILAHPETPQRMEARADAWADESGRRFWVDLRQPPALDDRAGRQWEIRRRDPEAEEIQARIEDMEGSLRAAQQRLDTYLLRRQDPPPEVVAEKDLRYRELQDLRQALTRRTEEFREFLAERLRSELADPREGVGALRVEGGRVSFEGRTVFPVDADQADKFAHELRLKLGWEGVRWTFRPGDSGQFRVEAVLPGPEASAGFGRSDRVRPLGAAVASALDSQTLDAGTREAVEFLVESVAQVIAGVRNNLVQPFPDTRYRPQKVDYFSSYLLMAVTDVIAVVILLYLIKAERLGRIQRRGKIEDEASRLAGTGKEARP